LRDTSNSLLLKTITYWRLRPGRTLQQILSHLILYSQMVPIYTTKLNVQTFYVLFCFLDRAFSIMRTKINQQNAQINSGLICAFCWFIFVLILRPAHTVYLCALYGSQKK